MPIHAQDRASELLRWRRDTFFRELLTFKGGAGGPWREQAAELGLPADLQLPFLSLWEAEVPDNQRLQAIWKLQELAELLAPGESALFGWNGSRWGLLLPWKHAGLIETLHTTLLQAGVRCSVGIGNPCRTLGLLQGSYLQAEKALENRFYEGMGRVLVYKEQAAPRQLEEVPEAAEKELFERLAAADSAAEIPGIVEEFYRSLLAGGPLAVSCVHELTIRLLIRTERRVLSESGNVSVYKRCEVSSIIRMQTLAEIQLYVGEFLAVLKDLLARSQRDNHRGIIKKTLQYMEDQCSTATLCSAAQHVYMTPTYLSLLFKMHTGKTFIEHLTDLRMEKAKELLRSTPLKNYEVALAVGYQDPRYFSQIFRKKAGQSPSEYRESAGS